MADYITLLGAEQVQRAASQMDGAASEMTRAANTFDCAVDRLIRAMQEHADRMEALNRAER